MAANVNPFSDLDAMDAKVTSPSPTTNPSKSGADPFSDLDAMDAKITRKPPAQTPSYDVPKSFGSGIVSGTESLMGLPGDVQSGINYGMDWAAAHTAEKLGLLPQGQTASDAMAAKRNSPQQKYLSDRPFDLPTGSEVHSAAQSAGVPDYTPQTVPGQYAYTVGQFVPGAAAIPVEGPGGFAANMARYAVAPGVASEVAGQTFKGTRAEPFARVAAGIAGGSAAAGLNL